MQSLLARRQADVARINDHIAEVGVIEKLAADYWLAAGAADDLGEKVASARLRGALDVSRTFREAARPLMGARFADYLALEWRLVDAATSGAFEAVGRAPDPVRAIAAIRACHDLRGLLRAQRPRLFWAR